MKYILILIFLTSCKSSFFAYERPMPNYDPQQKIVVMKIAKQTPAYSVYKLKPVDEWMPFYLRSNLKLSVGDVVNYYTFLK